jgi:hypothetical protein
MGRKGWEAKGWEAKAGRTDGLLMRGRAFEVKEQEGDITYLGYGREREN